MNIDLTVALARYYAEHDDRRDDWRQAHVGDLAMCARKAWHRRHGDTPLPVSAEMRMKWAIGHAVEAHVAEALISSLRDECLPLWFNNSGVVTIEGVIGHPDVVLFPLATTPFSTVLPPLAVIELKSTSFLRGKPPEKASEWYVTQAAAYATALAAPKFAVFVVDRESGRVAEFWFDTADYVQEVRDLAKFIVDVTDPAKPAPPPDPVFAWECRYCDFAQCPKHPQHAANGG